MASGSPTYSLKWILDNDKMPNAERVAAIAAATPEMLAQQIEIPTSTVMRNLYDAHMNAYWTVSSQNGIKRRYKNIPTQRFTVLDYAVEKAVPVELVAALLDKGIDFDRENIISKLFDIRSFIYKYNRGIFNYEILLDNNNKTLRLFLERGAEIPQIDLKLLLNTNDDNLIMMFLTNDQYKDEYIKERLNQNPDDNLINYIIILSLNVPNTFIDFLKPLQFNGHIYPPFSLFQDGRQKAPIYNLIFHRQFDLLRLYRENFPEDYKAHISNIFRLIIDVHKNRKPTTAIKYIIELGLLEDYLEADPTQFSEDIKKNRKIFLDFLLNEREMPDRVSASRYLEMLTPYFGLTNHNETGGTFLHDLARIGSPYYENVVALAGVDPSTLRNIYRMTPANIRKRYISNTMQKINNETERRLESCHPANRKLMRPYVRESIRKGSRGGKRQSKSKSKRQTRRRSH
jgi:hypothetical protein